MLSFISHLIILDQVRPTVQIRSKYDDQIADFYADNLGSLGLHLDGKGFSLAQWIGELQGYIRICYDESGQERHATQYIPSSQPNLNNQIDFTAQSGTA